MNKTLITAIASVIAFIVLAINTIFNTDFQIPAEIVESIATLLAVAIMWFISHYYNQDYSDIAKRATPVMRKVKKLVKEGDSTLLDAIEHLLEEWEGGKNDD